MGQRCTDFAPVTAPSEARRGTALGEGIALALLTALSYALTFAFERGYSAAFGLPLEVIDLSTTSVIFALVTLFASFGSVFQVLDLAFGFYPELLKRGVVFRHFVLAALGPLLLGVLTLAVVGFRHWGVALFIMLAGAGALLGVVAQPFFYRDKPTLEEKVLHAQAENATVPSLYGLLVAYVGWRGLLLVVGSVIMLVLALLAGTYKAKDQEWFFVIDRGEPYVLARIYDHTIFAVQADTTKHLLRRSVRTFAVGDTSVTMHRRKLGRLEMER